MTNAGFTRIEQYADIESLNYYAAATGMGLDEAQVLRGLAVKSRDNARTPVQWDDGVNAGFSTGRPWLPVNANHSAINAAAARADEGSVFHHYRTLIELRHAYEIVREGRFALLLLEHEQVFAYTRTLGEQVLLVVANLSCTAVPLDGLDLPDVTGAAVLLATDANPGAGALRPYESIVYLVG